MAAKKKTIIVERSNKTVYREGDALVKVFEKEHAKSGVFNEAHITSLVESYGVPAAAVRFVEEIDGKWAIGVDYVEGETLAEKMKNEPDNYDALLEKFVDIQVAVSGYKAVGLRNTVDKRAEEINALPDLDPSTRYELLQRLHGMKRHTKLCHGDFNPSNIIIRNDGSWVVVDWSHATQGNAGADAALTYLELTMQDADTAEKYLKLYSRKSDIAIQYIQKWMPIVAAGQLAKAKTEEEKALLTRWISIADYE
ncbi:MAG: aminoglycoside phosphotransferase family protein [Lachnospiraceae bacterium]|nr:aminoglycoside phosphotransferase family protein [Lachnospiraceae bacterium]